MAHNRGAVDLLASYWCMQYPGTRTYCEIKWWYGLSGNGL